MSRRIFDRSTFQSRMLFLARDVQSRRFIGCSRSLNAELLKMFGTAIVCND